MPLEKEKSVYCHNNQPIAGSIDVCTLKKKNTGDRPLGDHMTSESSFCNFTLILSFVSLQLTTDLQLQKLRTYSSSCGACGPPLLENNNSAVG